MGKPEDEGRRDGDVDQDAAERSLRSFEEWVANPPQPRHVFRLYVAGNSSRSRQAIRSVREVCEQYLPGNYELDVIDVYQQPEVAKAADVIALPTLIKEEPRPPRKFVGDMSDVERLVAGLRLRS